MEKKTLMLSYIQWERVDMALDIAIIRSRDYGSGSAMEEYRQTQEEIRKQREDERLTVEKREGEANEDKSTITYQRDGDEISVSILAPADEIAEVLIGLFHRFTEETKAYLVEEINESYLTHGREGLSPIASAVKTSAENGATVNLNAFMPRR